MYRQTTYMVLEDLLPGLLHGEACVVGLVDVPQHVGVRALVVVVSRLARTLGALRARLGPPCGVRGGKELVVETIVKVML